jgi:pimeloyl-ACP methyl ester carboxylesterase
MTLKLSPIVDGDAGLPTIVFVQGWPDDASLWDEAVTALRGKYRCVRMNLPNYGGNITARWGYRTEEIVDAVADVLRTFGAERPVTLVLHDWGCYWGHAAHQRAPEAVSRVAGFDVAPHYAPGVGAILGIMAYQWWLYGAFVIGGPVGNWMTRRMAKAAGAPADASRIDSRMNYPYRNVWADLASGRAEKMTENYWPKCPLLFVYGEKKPFPFHSKAWTEHVKSVGGEVVGLPCGHWVQRHPSFLGVFTRWLETSARPS